MAPIPFRRRKATKTERTLGYADAALAMAKSRAAAGTSRSSGRGRLILAGAALAAAAGVAVAARDKVAGLLPSRSGDAVAPPPPAPPQPSNYDAPGPVANTATPIPAPDPVTPPAADAGEAPAAADFGPPRPAIDERAEEEAAAAEAAAIGGAPSDYAGISLDEPATEAERPVVEAGGGEAEGQEQTEAELADNATMRDQAPSDAERQIEDAIDAQSQPASGETPEPLAPVGEAGDTVFEGGGISGRPGARLGEETPGVPATGTPGTPPETPGGEQEGDGDTWSGRADQP